MLIDIQNAISDIELFVDGREVLAWKLDEAKNSVETADLPRRIMLPVGADGDGATAMEYMGFNGGMVITWRITELMLWQPIARGYGRGVFGDLAKYIDAYARAISAIRRPTPNSMITLFQPAAGIYNWPAGGATDYYGVKVAFSVTETICAED